MNEFTGNEEIFGAIIIVMIIAFSFMFIMYLLNALALGLWLKKSNIRHWGLAFVPLASTYKQLHYVYDAYRLNKLGIDDTFTKSDISQALSNNNSHESDYTRTRRRKSVGMTFAFIIISFLLGVATAMYDIWANSGDTTVVSEYASIALSIVMLAIISYATFRTVSTKVDTQNYKRFSVGKSIVLAVVSVVTVGLAYIVLLFIYALSNKYHYVFDYMNDNLKND